MGTRVKTILPGQVYHSTISNVTAGTSATIEMELPGAMLSFAWTFGETNSGRTRITQRLWLAGTAAEAFVAQARVLEQSAPQGMARLASAIADARG